MICACWNGSIPIQEMDSQVWQLEKRIQEQIDYIYKTLGIKPLCEVKREQWEKENDFDPKTQTTHGMRLKAILQGLTYCYNMFDELVVIYEIVRTFRST